MTRSDAVSPEGAPEGVRSDAADALRDLVEAFSVPGAIDPDHAGHLVDQVRALLARTEPPGTVLRPTDPA